MRLPFCSPFHVFLTSGQMLRELAWCGFRSWCKHEWTAVVQMASLRVWMLNPQTTVWRWQGLPTAPLWGTPYTFHPNIWPEESCFNENLFKLQNYNTNISQYLKGLPKYKHLGVSIYLSAPPVWISGDACWPLYWGPGLLASGSALLGYSSPPYSPRWS